MKIAFINKLKKTKIGAIIANTSLDKKFLTTDISKLLEDKFYCSVTGKEIKDYAYWSPDTYRIYGSKTAMKNGFEEYSKTHNGMDSIDNLIGRTEKCSISDLSKKGILIINKSNSYKSL